ncbi:carboxypeptidase M32 [Pullulanibacillus sp. KACC 23026]|uniref:carboxypeptidase M32 n=1 Tax=Pullulanibacillus sp. KACC 23026 TaxID=3028315 RepID=UPI0023B1591E|nr:carboxypeptidase M32 [Pullulanibacillus sp. KACC 23026]WEG10792.1 carboxypeptidase M32 [Pullulanibacillus sp. KACC 23026]
MTNSIKEIEKNYYSLVKKMENYKEALGVLGWDLRTGAPKKGIAQRSEVIGTLSQEIYNLSTSDEMKSYIDALTDPSVQNGLSPVTKRSIEEAKKKYDQNMKIPPKEFHEYVVLQSNAENVWEEAKQAADFSRLQPYLEKLVDYNQRFIGYWGTKETKYDVLLDQYEPGVTVKTIDRVFNQVREAIVPLVQAISEAGQPQTDFLFQHFPKEDQHAFGLYMLKEIGYDLEAGRLDVTEHPFATGLNPGDVRVTTHYRENDFRVALFGTLHEGGHGIYEQNLSKDLIGTGLCTGTSMGIHESQSLFFEKFIGQNRALWNHYYPQFQKYAKGKFDQVNVDDFYRAVNVAGPSLIRIEADELTYPLHIMVRYEIEKGLFNGDFKVKDLPGIWNEKYKAYLGLEPSNDREGVLQDIHWSGGSFGYFPSYALGYIYAAQFQQAMLNDLPNYDALLAEGQITPIRQWLNQNIHQYGALKKPIEIIQDVTGHSLQAEPLIRYLTDKYRSLYNL